MASVVFGVRGTGTDAYYSGGEKTGTRFNSGNISVTSNATPLSGSFIDLTTTGVVKFLSWSGVRNTSNQRSFSILLRFAPNYSGAPAGTRSLFCLNSGTGTSGAYLELLHSVTTGNITITCKNETAAISLNAVSLGAWTTGVSGTYYDLCLLWDGTTTSGAVKCFIDNVSLGTGTAASALLSTWDNTYWKSICLGASPNATASSYKIDEFILWDGAINTSSVQLDSGLGALNGSSRTSPVTLTKYNGPPQYSRGRIVNQ